MASLKSVGSMGLAGVVLFGATSALACVPMPRDTAGELANARSAFLARVTAVENGDQAACEAGLRAAGVNEGDPGSRSCEAFGVARLETVHIISGEAPEPVVAEWNAYPFCYVGWTPAVGDVVVATVPSGDYTFTAPITAYVDPQDQHDTAVRAMIAQQAGH